LSGGKDLYKDDGLIDNEIATIERIIRDNGNDPNYLVKILQEVQEALGYVPVPGQRLIAEKLGVPTSKIYGIVSFYNLFRLSPPGRHSINVCMGTACYVRGASSILNEIRTKYSIEPGGTTIGRRFSLEVLRCLGCCAIGPVITVDGRVYGHMRTSKVTEILDKYN
jgi:NADH:ubiquinone oxidoreductase subunit E